MTTDLKWMALNFSLLFISILCCGSLRTYDHLAVCTCKTWDYHNSQGVARWGQLKQLFCLLWEPGRR